ncbi:MAG: hypothetical protein E6J71_28155 [Deltaproteobacteria bacterium]|nr:MAG: hypothetical protein E6J76_13960 [Deltaproteobacteria bacterium]TMA91707.1 MAG: hypothetical protein E6J77_06070 [Deltaproteobacteria bacterium]TMB09398.1 MAG: hypothetical protein E6J71_28155 [Deltaproteobacteria bacterium]
MRKTVLNLLVLAFAMIRASQAFAGIADSPLPVLVSGQTTLHLYSVPGVMNDGSSNFGTFFSCTSTSTSSQTVGVEVFPTADGGALNNAATAAVSLAASATVTFGTQNASASSSIRAWVLAP